MSDSSTYLTEYQRALAAQGIDPTPLEREAEALELLSGTHLKQALESFRASADRVPSVWDSDYGALLLEALGDKCVQTEPQPSHRGRRREAKPWRGKSIWIASPGS